MNLDLLEDYFFFVFFFCMENYKNSNLWMSKICFWKSKHVERKYHENIDQIGKKGWITKKCYRNLNQVV